MQLKNIAETQKKNLRRNLTMNQNNYILSMHPQNRVLGLVSKYQHSAIAAQSGFILPIVFYTQ